MKPSLLVFLTGLASAGCQLRTDSGIQDDSGSASGSSSGSGASGSSAAGSATGAGSSGSTSPGAATSGGSIGTTGGATTGGTTTAGTTTGATATGGATTGGTTTGSPGCSPACGAGATCVEGACKCLPGFTACGSECADTDSDIYHCGSCKDDCTVIGSGMSSVGCTGGQCVCGPTGQGKICPGGVCANENIDPQNCGGCGNLCTLPTTDCIDGNCACPDGDTACQGFCVKTTQNDSNCGSCGYDCSTSYATNSGCRFGICACSPGQTELCGDAGSGNAACVPTGTCGE